MDRTKEEQTVEQDKESSNLILTSIPTPINTNILEVITGDILTTSLESSGTFENWTLVSDKLKRIDPVIVKDNDDSRIEILKNAQYDELDVYESKFDHRMQESLKDDDDDISIISETESVCRISPHSYVRDHLYDLNLQFSTTDNMEDEDDTHIKLPQDQAEQDLHLRRRSSSTKDEALQKPLQTTALPSDNIYLKQQGSQYIFYVSIGLAILAIIAKIVMVIWQRLAGVDQLLTTSAHLQQKVLDMELENYLMKAQIETLYKQSQEPPSQGTYQTFQDNLKGGFGYLFENVLNKAEEMKKLFAEEVVQDKLKENLGNLKDNFLKYADYSKETIEKFASPLKEKVLNKAEEVKKLFAEEVVQDKLKENLGNLKDNLLKYADYSKETFEKFASPLKEKVLNKAEEVKNLFVKPKKNTMEKIQDKLKETYNNLFRLF